MMTPHETTYAFARCQNADALSSRSSARISADARREWSSTALWMNAGPRPGALLDPVALRAAVDPVPATVRDPAELLELNVDQVAGAREYANLKWPHLERFDAWIPANDATAVYF